MGVRGSGHFVGVRVGVGLGVRVGVRVGLFVTRCLRALMPLMRALVPRVRAPMLRVPLFGNGSLEVPHLGSLPDELVHVMLDDRGAGRRTTLTLEALDTRRNTAVEDDRRCGSWQRQRPMGTLDRPEARLYRRGEDTFRRDRLDYQAYLRDVANTRRAPDLVEMRRLYRRLVNGRLRLGQNPIDRSHVRANLFTYRKAINGLEYRRKVGMVSLGDVELGNALVELCPRLRGEPHAHLSQDASPGRVFAKVEI